MKATRRTQPYRANKARPAGPSLYAMLAGRGRFQRNPMDVKRQLQKRRKRRRRNASAPTRYSAR